MLAQIERYAPRDGRILDFGAGIGLFADMLRDRDYRVSCLEVDPEMAHGLEQQGFETVRSLGELADASIDFLYSLNVLEHIDDDVAALPALAPKLRSGGRCLFYVPAFLVLFSAMDRLVGHHRRYTAASLTRSVESAGLRVGRVEYADSLGFPASLAYRIVGGDGVLNPSSVGATTAGFFPPAARSITSLAAGSARTSSRWPTGLEPDLPGYAVGTRSRVRTEREVPIAEKAEDHRNGRGRKDRGDRARAVAHSDQEQQVVEQRRYNADQRVPPQARHRRRNPERERTIEPPSHQHRRDDRRRARGERRHRRDALESDRQAGVDREAEQSHEAKTQELPDEDGPTGVPFPGWPRGTHSADSGQGGGAPRQRSCGRFRQSARPIDTPPLLRRYCTSLGGT